MIRAYCSSEWPWNHLHSQCLAKACHIYCHVVVTIVYISILLYILIVAYSIRTCESLYNSAVTASVNIIRFSKRILNINSLYGLLKMSW